MAGAFVRNAPSIRADEVDLKKYIRSVILHGDPAVQVSMLILLSHVFHHNDEVLIGHEVSGSSSGRELEFSSAIRFAYTKL